MSVFFADLDNTLIYSHRRSIGKEKLPVEYLDGKQQSYMTNYSYRFLKDAKWIDIVPVTTRTYEQFRRLTFMEDLHINNAIVCNGGMLLKGEKEDEEWSLGTMRLTNASLDALTMTFDMLTNDKPKTVIHRPTPYMVYFKSNDPVEESQKLRDLVNAEFINVEHDQRKIYLFVSGIDKGTAVVRYKKKMSVEIDVAAGDDAMDVPMLNLARYALASSKIAPLVKNKNLIVIDGEQIADGICDELQRLHDAGKIHG